MAQIGGEDSTLLCFAYNILTNLSTNSIDDMLAGESIEEDVEGTWQDVLGDRMEEIIDRKRSSEQGREKALAAYNYLLMAHYAYEEVENKLSELVPALLKSVKSDSSEKEASLALRAIALTLITAPSDSLYEMLEQTLKRIYTVSEHNTVKAAAIYTLAAAATYGGAGDSECEAIMDSFIEIIESDGNSIEAEDSGEVVTAAAEAWGFLATYAEDISESTEIAMEAFVEQLESSDPSVQIAVGENIALCYEKSYTPIESDEDGYANGKDAYVKRYEVYRQQDQLEHRLSEISKESARHIAKKDRKSLHQAFADILHGVEKPTLGPRYSEAIDQETDKPYGSRLKIRIHKSGSVTIDKWWKLHRLQGLRRILGGGFVRHYMDNEVVFETLPIMIEGH